MNVRLKLTLSVLLTTSLLSGCITAKKQALLAAKAAGELQASNTLPNYPSECRRLMRSGVRDGERLDIAVERSDIAIGEQNKRTRRCAAWYDNTKKAYAEIGAVRNGS